jgi:plasmid stabilization system protein ParE
MSIVFRPQARQELADLLAGIRAANPLAADNVQDEVQHTLELLEANPLSGPQLRMRKASLRELRFATVRSYPQFVILYLPLTDGVEVLHIVRGKRNLRRVVAHD